MKLIAQVKLVVTPEQSEALLKTLEAANALCNELSVWAWQNKVFGKYAIQTARYHQVRSESGLTAQVVIRCIAKVANAYKTAFALHKEHVKRTERINKTHQQEPFREERAAQRLACDGSLRVSGARLHCLR